jgi:hypothetical protein
MERKISEGVIGNIQFEDIFTAHLLSHTILAGDLNQPEVKSASG